MSFNIIYTVMDVVRSSKHNPSIRTEEEVYFAPGEDGIKLQLRTRHHVEG